MAFADDDVNRVAKGLGGGAEWVFSKACWIEYGVTSLIVWFVNDFVKSSVERDFGIYNDCVFCCASYLVVDGANKVQGRFVMVNSRCCCTVR